MTPPNPYACAWFLLAAFTCAGVAQTAWFAWPVSRRFAAPLDGGLTVRGRRVFGDNKTLRGFVVMVPASALAFLALAAGTGDPGAVGLWPLSPGAYALAGALAGLGFMAGELPNSFIKRQLDVRPGTAPSGSAAALCQFIGDRLDSGIGMLAALSLVVTVPLATWITVLAVGPAIHWTFSLAMFLMGLKRRAA